MMSKRFVANLTKRKNGMKRIMAMEGFDTLKRLTKDQPVWIEFSVEQAVYDAVEQFLRRFELSVEEAAAAYIIELVKMRDQIIFEYDSGKAPEKYWQILLITYYLVL